MTGINKIFIAGNLGRKPVIHKSKNGKNFLFLHIATHRHSHNKESGLWDEFTDWHSVIVWGKTAELCERYLDKGSPVAIEGSLESTKDDKTIITAEEVHFLGIRTKEASASRNEAEISVQ